jgi:hypothetical protein
MMASMFGGSLATWLRGRPEFVQNRNGCFSLADAAVADGGEEEADTGGAAAAHSHAASDDDSSDSDFDGDGAGGRGSSGGEGEEGEGENDDDEGGDVSDGGGGGGSSTSGSSSGAPESYDDDDETYGLFADGRARVWFGFAYAWVCRNCLGTNMPAPTQEALAWAHDASEWQRQRARRLAAARERDVAAGVAAGAAAEEEESADGGGGGGGSSSGEPPAAPALGTENDKCGQCGVARSEATSSLLRLTVGAGCHAGDEDVVRLLATLDGRSTESGSAGGGGGGHAHRSGSGGSSGGGGGGGHHHDGHRERSHSVTSPGPHHRHDAAATAGAPPPLSIGAAAAIGSGGGGAIGGAIGGGGGGAWPPVVIAYDERMLRHREIPPPTPAMPPDEPSLFPRDKPHPERPDRLAAIATYLLHQGVFGRCTRVPAREARNAELATVHDAAYCELIAERARTLGGGGSAKLDAMDTYMCGDSHAAARLAVGSLVDVTDRVVRGAASAGVALIRPPGHHAEASHAMGFCLFNNVGVAVGVARSRMGVRRVLVVDWDVHHGNGTQVRAGVRV